MYVNNLAVELPDGAQMVSWTSFGERGGYTWKFCAED